MKVYSEAAVREALVERMKSTKQVVAAMESGVDQPRISLVLRGAPMPAKLTAWLGYEEVKGIYRRTK